MGLRARALRLALLLAVLAPAAARAEEPGAAERCEAAAKRRLAGFVVAVSGAATAESPICGRVPRQLVCGELVFEGDRVRTAASARVDLLLKGLRAEVGGGSEVRLGITADGAPDVEVAQGHVRMIDGRTDAEGPPYRLATPDLSTLVRGAGSEAAVEGDSASASSRVCGRGSPIDVTRLGGVERTTAAPGECVYARPHLALYASPSREAMATLAELPQCNLVGDVRDRFDPSDVASGPVAFAPGPPSQLGPSQEPCTVGSTCGPPTAPPNVVPPVVNPPAPVIESPPVFRPPPGLPPRK